MLYDMIIIGAGAAGLFAGASLCKPVKGLILDKGSAPGQKILMSGGGQCNVTHGGSIKDFISHYGKNGSCIRTLLYQFSNQDVMKFFEDRGVPMLEREDGKIFPESMNAKDIVHVLEKACIRNGFQIQYRRAVTYLSRDLNTGIYTVHCERAAYRAAKLIVTTGGCSYPTTGSDGQFFSVLTEMGFEVVPPSPALVPVYVEEYPYKDLSGISFPDIAVSVCGQKKIAETRGDILLAHDCFSGPAILNISRYAKAGLHLAMNYIPDKTAEGFYKEMTALGQGSPKTLLSVLSAYLNPDPTKPSALMPKRFLETICRRCGVDPGEKFSRIPGAKLKEMGRLFTNDAFTINRMGGYNIAMVTSGGISLEEVQLKTLESKKYPGLYFAGEVLDIDGDSGGYNLQFAFSSAHLAAMDASKDISPQ